MFDWLGLSSVYGMCFVILPVLYILRKLFKVRKEKRAEGNEQLMKVEAAAAAAPKLETPTEQYVDNSRKIDVDVDEMRTAVDLINFQLILIESKIYKDIEPVPPLSMDEFSAAVRQWEYIKTKSFHFAIADLE